MTRGEIIGAVVLAVVAVVWWMNRNYVVVGEQPGTITTDTNQASSGAP